jgi:hypothetical protein
LEQRIFPVIEKPLIPELRQYDDLNFWLVLHHILCIPGT